MTDLAQLRTAVPQLASARFGDSSFGHDVMTTQPVPQRVPGPVRILLLCTANRVRSPAAERILARHALERSLDIAVASAGVDAVAGREMDETMLELLAKRGIPTQDHVAHPLSLPELQVADLVIGMERYHAAAAVDAYPRAFHKTFTLLDLADRLPLAPAPVLDLNEPMPDPAERLRRVLQSLAASRGTTGLLGFRGPDDLADPSRRGRRQYRKCVKTIDRATDTIAIALDRILSQPAW